MADIVQSVGDLTDLRDKDALEHTLATVMFELLDASALTLWRIGRRQGETKLFQRVRLRSRAARRDGDDDGATEDPILTLAARPELRSCHDSNLHLRLPPLADGMCGHVFPVADDREAICLLEIWRPEPLREDQERLVFGLLRIYRNHLGVLDYGDSDELTGLLNRRTFDESFRRLALPEARKPHPWERRAERSDPHAYLGVADVDFFKRVNDRFGHPYGDEVLILMARLMRESFRETDRLFRFGGEEFLVILPDSSPEAAAQALERFRATVESFEFPQVGRVTVSIGYTAVLPNDTGSNAFGRADEALYVAKQQGRNQVRAYERLIADGVLRPKAAANEGIELF